MKKVLTTALLGSVIALSAGMLGVYSYFDTQLQSYSVPLTAGMISGHLTLTLTDADGNIKAYQQTDNFIIESGEDCAAKLLFVGSGNTAATNSELCVDAIGTFNNMVLLNSSGTCSPAASDSALTTGTCTLSDSTNTGLGPVTITIGDGATVPSSGVGVAHIDLDNNFSPLTSDTIQAAALTNSTSNTASDHKVFAKTSFTNVAVNSGDTLTINWDIEIGGAGTLGGE